MSNQIKPDENKMNKDGSSNIVPQSFKGMTLEEARLFLRNTMDLFFSLAPMTDLKTLYEAGKQLSRLYFDCSSHQKELAEILLELDFPEYAIKTMKKLNNMGVFKNDDIWFSSFYLYNICWNYSDASFEFATSLALCGLPNLLSLNIGHKPYLDNLSSRNVYYLIKASLSIIHNICRYPGSCLHFRSESVRCSLRNLIDREEDFIRVVASLCLASVVGETEAGNMLGGPGFDNGVSENTAPTSTSIDVLKSIMGYVKKARSSERARFMGFRSHELLQGVRAATTTEAGRRRFLCPELDGSSLLREALLPNPSGSGTQCSDEDIAECLEIACNLAVGGYSSKIYELTGLDSTILKGMTANHVPSRIRNAAEDLLWATEGPHDIPETELNLDCDPDEIPTIAFVHSIVNRFSVNKIRDRLQTDRPGLVRILPLIDMTRYKCQDAYQLIKEADIVIVCVSEATKAIPRCQLQLQLANKSHKAMLALLVQQKYKPDAWLAQLLTDIQLFDLSSKRDFESVWESFMASLGEAVNNRKQQLIRKREEAAQQLAKQQVKQEKVAASQPTPLSQQVQVMSNNEDHQHLADPISTRGSGTGSGNSITDYARFNGASVTDDLILTGSTNPTRIMGGPSGEGPPYASVNPPTTPASTVGSLNNPLVDSVPPSGAHVANLARWLEKHQLCHIGPTLARTVLASDPELLSTYREIKRTAPNFFYESLERHLKLDIADILRFSRAIDDF